MMFCDVGGWSSNWRIMGDNGYVGHKGQCLYMYAVHLNGSIICLYIGNCGLFPCLINTFLIKKIKNTCNLPVPAELFIILYGDDCGVIMAALLFNVWLYGELDPIRPLWFIPGNPLCLSKKMTSKNLAFPVYIITQHSTT